LYNGLLLDATSEVEQVTFCPMNGVKKHGYDLIAFYLDTTLPGRFSARKSCLATLCKLASVIR